MGVRVRIPPPTLAKFYDISLFVPRPFTVSSKCGGPLPIWGKILGYALWTPHCHTSQLADRECL